MTALRGKLGRANWKGVWGWALDAATPGQRLEIEIVVDDAVAGVARADDPRPGLKILAEDQRDCGFEFLFPAGLSALAPHVVRARVAATGEELEDSPMLVEADPGFTPALEQTVSASLQASIAGAQTEAELDEPLRLVSGQLNRLLKLRSAMPGASAVQSSAIAALQERWARLPGAFSRPNPDRSEAAVSGARRVLVVAETPPVLDASARALLAQLQSLVRLGLNVEFAAAACSPESKAFAAALEAAGIAFCRPPLFPSVEDVLLRNRFLYDVVMLHRIGSFGMYATLARRYCPRARLVFGLDHLAFVQLARRAALQNWPAGAEKASALRLHELMAAWSADAIIANSDFEAKLLRAAVPQARVHVVGWPLTARWPAWPFAERSGVAIIGDFRRHADLDAAAWLLGAVLPAVWAIDPSIRCLLAGGDVPDTLALPDDARVEAITDPAVDRRQVLDHVRVSVASWRYGAGLNASVVESFAAGVACAATPLAMEGLASPEPFRDWIAGDAEGLAALICRLHASEALNAACADAGSALISRSFSTAEIDRRMLEVVGVADPVPAQQAPEQKLAAD